MGLHILVLGYGFFFVRSVKVKTTLCAVTLIKERPQSHERSQVRLKEQPRSKKLPKIEPKPEPKKEPVTKKPTIPPPPKSQDKVKVKEKVEKKKPKDDEKSYQDVKSAIARMQEKAQEKALEKVAIDESIESVKESIKHIQKKVEEQHFVSEQVQAIDEAQLNYHLKTYYDQLWGLIKSQYILPESGFDKGKDLVTVVSIQIDRDGTIKKLWYESESGEPLVDKAAMAAIQRVGKFPPLPPELSVDSLDLGIRFSTAEVL